MWHITESLKNSVVENAATIGFLKTAVAFPTIARTVKMCVFWQIDRGTTFGHFSISALTPPTLAVRYVVKIGVGWDHDGITFSSLLKISPFARPRLPKLRGS